MATAVRLGIPTPAFSAALAYYDGYRSERLPANLFQAQRDYFGAHTYRRVDKPGKVVPQRLAPASQAAGSVKPDRRPALRSAFCVWRTSEPHESGPSQGEWSSLHAA